jgi:large subunit ribosomal protein L15
MALNLSSRAARTACATSKSIARPIATLISSRTYATSPEETNQEKPRWSYTPAQAKAPFSLHLHTKRPIFHVNSDPELLDRFYIRLLGNGGDKFLSDETKWLAVTHKSFDQGRRGFNDRLAFLGKRIVQLQASLALAQNVSAPANAQSEVQKDQFGRVPFTHPALDGLSNLSAETKKVLTERSKLAELGQKYDLQKVIRWSPRKVCPDVNLALSQLTVSTARRSSCIRP